MKQLTYIALLVFLAITGCQKNEFENYEIEKSHVVTDSTLKAKYLDPFQKGQVIELIVKPKQHESFQTYYLTYKDGQYAMLGKSRQYANPAELEIKFGTNKVSATIDFTEASLFPAFISDMGEELTRGADHSYAFVGFENGKFQLEGIQYGDHLKARIIDMSSAEAQHILNNGILKDYQDQENFYYKQPFMAFTYAGTPVQMVVDPFNSSVWIFHSQYRDIFDYITNSPIYQPVGSEGVLYSTSALGDTLIFNREITLVEKLKVKGLIWNKERTQYTAWVSEGNATRNESLQLSKYPFYSYTEIGAFITSEFMTRKFYLEEADAKMKLIYEVVSKLKIPQNIKIDLARLANDPSYSKDWTPRMKTKLLALVDKINQQNAPMKVSSFDIKAIHSFADLGGGFVLDTHIGIANQYKFELRNGEQVDSISYASNLLALNFLNSTNVIGFINPKSEKITMPAANKLSPRLKNIWPDFVDFLAPFDEAVIHMNFLPPAAGEEYPRIKMHSAKTGDILIGSGYPKP